MQDLQRGKYLHLDNLQFFSTSVNPTSKISFTPTSKQIRTDVFYVFHGSHCFVLMGG